MVFAQASHREIFSCMTEIMDGEREIALFFFCVGIQLFAAVVMSKLNAKKYLDAKGTTT
jgi:hypothetical protein